jgi:hypothetical protein
MLLTLIDDALLEVVDLGQGRVLPAGAEEIAKLVNGDAADTANVE